jgi:hypothetical protein
MKREQRGI